MRTAGLVRDGWWALVGGVFAVLLVCNAVAVVVLVLDGPRIWLVVAPVALLTDYWFIMGAWLRTSWGRPAVEAPGPPGPPGLSTRGALVMIVVAAACVVAAAIALAVQLHNAGY